MRKAFSSLSFLLKESGISSVASLIKLGPFVFENCYFFTISKLISFVLRLHPREKERDGKLDGETMPVVWKDWQSRRSG